MRISAPFRFPSIEPLESRIAPAFAAVINLAALSGADGAKFHGEAAADFAGRSVGGAGDVNGDGFADFIIGADGADQNGTYSGVCYVVFGKAAVFPASTDLSSLNGVNGFKIQGEAAHDFLGRPVSAAGDVNGDGFDDIIIGADNAHTTDTGAGASYVIFGKDSAFSATLNVSTLSGGDGFKIQGQGFGARAGRSVSAAGDVNGDGYADLLIGSDGVNSYTGATYLVFGKASGFTSPLNLSSLNGTTGFKISGEATGDSSGRSVSGAGDVNGDGFDDLLIGAERADPNGADSGAGYVVFGKASGFASTLGLSSLTGADGFKILGEAAGDRAGRSVSRAGDVNGDGFADIIIGASAASPNGATSGSSYVIFGKDSGFSATLSLSALNGSTGFKIQGAAANDATGFSVSGAGDVNGDGFADVLVGSDPAITAPGVTYLIFGKATGFASTLNVSALDGSNGIKFQGATAGDNTGFSVSVVGDVNADGFADLLIGAPGADQNGSRSGTAYLLYGTTSEPFPVVTPTFSADLKTATFTDVDGDLVTVKTTLGTFDATNFTIYAVPGSVTGGGQLAKLGLNDSEFAGASITITAKRSALGGDGLVNLGFLDATGVDLGAFLLKGDLGRLEIGDANAATSAATSVTVSSLGAFGVSSQSGIAQSNVSHAIGALPMFTVTHDVGGIELHAASFGTVKIGGTVDGAAIYVSGATASFTITGDLDQSTLALSAVTTLAVTGDVTHSTISAHAIGSITPGAVAGAYIVAGRLSIGGDVRDAQVNVAGALAVLKISGDVTESSYITADSFGQIQPGARAGSYGVFGGVTVGGDFDDSSLFSTGAVAALTISGSVSGGALLHADSFGKVAPTATPGVVLPVGALTIVGSFSLSSITADGDIGLLNLVGGARSSSIEAGDIGVAKFGRTIKTVALTSHGTVYTASALRDVIGSDFAAEAGFGTLTAGAVAGTVKANGGFTIAGAMVDSTLKTNGDLAKLTVRQRLDGSTVSARGDLNPGTDVVAATIGSVAIAGRISHSSILAGYDISGDAVNADAQIGAVTVGTNWIASNLIAGAEAGIDGLFGTADDLAIGGGNAGIISRIASVTIAGHVRGTPGGVDGFGIVAQEIKALTASATKIPLLVGPSNDLSGFALGATLDARVRELA